MTRVLILGHGSRDAAANQEFESLVGEYARARPHLEISWAYTELAEPSLAVGLQEAARQARRVVVLPLFLFAAGHVKNDLPLAFAQARRDFPNVDFVSARALGVHPILVELVWARIASALEGVDPPRAAVVLVGRGSSDPDANGDFTKLTRLVGEGRNLAWVTPSFIGITRPKFEEAIELVARTRPERIVVAPYFLFAGRLLTKLDEDVAAFRKRYPWIRAERAPHLGPDPRLFELLDERLEEALAGARPLPCDNCQYRTPISAIAGQVGGLKALLYSVRHGVTHTQAMPHVHAHRPLRKHVLVCGNADCADRGSVALLGALRRQLADAGLERDVRVTRTSCMGRCGEGPTLAVYPDGIWYRGVSEADARELVREHLENDRIVARLVDNIMQ